MLPAGLAGSGRMSLVLTMIVGTLGSVIGTLMWYYVGLWFGEERLKRFAARQALADAVARRYRRGASVVRATWRRGGVLWPHDPGDPTLISAPAGLARMPMWRSRPIPWRAAPGPGC